MGGEATQLVLVIAALAVIYGAVMFWTKRSRQGRQEKPPFPGMEGSGNDPEAGSIGKAISGRAGSASSKRGERFHLTGRDAEVAAKVLKRMLKQGKQDT